MLLSNLMQSINLLNIFISDENINRNHKFDKNYSADSVITMKNVKASCIVFLESTLLFMSTFVAMTVN